MLSEKKTLYLFTVSTPHISVTKQRYADMHRAFFTFICSQTPIL